MATDIFLHELSHVAKAKVMTQIARDSDLRRKRFYKSLREGSKLRYETMQKILSALGARLTIIASQAEDTKEGEAA